MQSECTPVFGARAMFQAERSWSLLIMIRRMVDTRDGLLSSLLAILSPAAYDLLKENLQFNTWAWPAAFSHAHCKALPSMKSRITPICRQNTVFVKDCKDSLLWGNSC